MTGLAFQRLHEDMFRSVLRFAMDDKPSITNRINNRAGLDVGIARNVVKGSVCWFNIGLCLRNLRSTNKSVLDHIAIPMVGQWWQIGQPLVSRWGVE